MSEEIRLLDEPIAALGVKETASVAELVQRVVASGVSVLIVSHDIDVIKKLCSKNRRAAPGKDLV